MVVDSEPLFFSPDSSIDDTVCITVSITDDSITEYNEEFVVALDSNESDRVNFIPYSAKTITIINNDSKSTVKPPNR